MTLKLCIARPWEPPLPGAELVLFADPDSYTAEAELKEMLTTAMRYAKRHKVYVVPGRFSVSRRLCLCLIGPDGKAMGGQSALYLNLAYRGSLDRSDTLSVIETPFGRVSLLVDVDICYPQVSARAAELGANLLISSMYVQPQDLDAICADRVGIGAAVSNGIPVAAVMTNGAVVALPDGSCPLPFTDALPADLSLSLPEPGARGYELGRGRALLSGHRGLLGGLVNG